MAGLTVLAPGLEPLTLRLVGRRTLASYGSHFVTIAGLAIAVFVPLAVAETFVEYAVHDYWDRDGGSWRLTVLVIALTVTTASLFGQTFYAGVLDHLVGESQYGHAHRSLRGILRSLPFGKLALANVVIALAVVLGYMALVVPGLIVLTLFSIVGPLINIERRSVGQALRRSVALVRPHFWLAFFAVAVPLTLEHGAGHALNEVVWEDSFVAGLIANAIFAVAVGAFVGVVEVALAHELITRDRAGGEAPVARPETPRLAG